MTIVATYRYRSERAALRAAAESATPKPGDDAGLSATLPALLLLVGRILCVS